MSKSAPAYTVPIKPNRNLLNSKFEGYKLKVFNENSRLLHFQLPPITIPKIPTNSKLSYKEIQSKIHFNHLFKGFEINKGKGICFYLDSENFVVLVEYDPATSNVVTHRLLKINQTNYYGDVEEIPSQHLHSDYPSLRALSSKLLLVTNGSGTIFLVQINKNDDSCSYSGEILYQMEFKGHLQLKQESGLNNIPCVLLDGRIVEEDEHSHILFMVYNTVLNPNPITNSISGESAKEMRRVLFDISLLQLSVSPQYKMEIIHVIRGSDIPHYCNIEFNGAGYVIGSNSEYELVYKSSNQNDTTIEEKSTSVQDDNKVSPYIWTQTSSDVTICFQLPRGTPKTAIHCNFSQTHLSLTINLDNNLLKTNDSSKQPPIPCYAFTCLFDSIDPSASLWTIEPTIGLLTLHLEKRNHNTRWSHVFQHDDGVFETLDPNEFAEFRERLEKYTSDIFEDTIERSGQSEVFKPLQHPIGYDMEESIDYEGQSSIFMWFELEGNLTAKAAGGNEYLCRQFECLENAEISNNISLLPSVCLKSGVDGIVYSIGHPTSSSVSPLVITHIATFNAFAFVQASKREKRFVFHDPKNRFVIILEGNHRAFIYNHHEDREKYDEQSVVELTNDDSEIIGVQMASIENAHIMVLKSNSIIIVKLL